MQTLRLVILNMIGRSTESRRLVNHRIANPQFISLLDIMSQKPIPTDNPLVGSLIVISLHIKHRLD